MQQDLKTYEVNIAGMPLRLKATHDQETVNEILKMVEKHLEKNVSKSSRHNSTLLACLRLAEELYMLRQKTREELDQIESLTLDHISQLQVSQ